MGRMDPSIATESLPGTRLPQSKTAKDIARLYRLVETGKSHEITKLVSKSAKLAPVILDLLTDPGLKREAQGYLVNALAPTHIDRYHTEMLDFIISGSAPPNVRAHLLYRLSQHRKFPWETMQQILKGDHFPIELRKEAAERIAGSAPGRLKVALFHYLEETHAPSVLRLDLLVSYNGATNCGRRLLVKFQDQIVSPKLSSYQIQRIFELTDADRFNFRDLYSRIARDSGYPVISRFEAARRLEHFDPQLARETVLNLAQNLPLENAYSPIFKWLREREIAGAEHSACSLIAKISAYDTRESRWLVEEALAYLSEAARLDAKRQGARLARQLRRRFISEDQQSLYELAVKCELISNPRQLPAIYDEALRGHLNLEALAVLKALPKQVANNYREPIEQLILGSRNSWFYDAPVRSEALLEYSKLFGFSPKMRKAYQDTFRELRGSHNTHKEEILEELASLVADRFPRSLQREILGQKEHGGPHGSRSFAYNEKTRQALVNALFGDNFERNLALIDSLRRGRFGRSVQSLTIAKLIYLEDRVTLNDVAARPRSLTLDKVTALFSLSDPIYGAQAAGLLVSRCHLKRSAAAVIIQRSWSTEQRRHLPEWLISCSQYVSPFIRPRMLSYAHDLEKARELGFSCPYRYPPATLKQAIKMHSSKQIATDRPLIFVAFPREDHNGAFCDHNSQQMFLELTRLGFTTCIYEVSGASELLKAKRDFLEKTAGVAADHIILGAHGSPNMMAFGTIDDITEIQDPKQCLHVDHIAMLVQQGFSELLAEGGSALTISCAIGFGREHAKENILNSLRTLFPQAAPQAISGMEYSGGFNGIEFPSLSGPLKGSYQHAGHVWIPGRPMRRYSV